MPEDSAPGATSRTRRDGRGFRGRLRQHQTQASQNEAQGTSRYELPTGLGCGALLSSRFEPPGDVRTVMRVLYLVFNEGYSGDVDLAAEAIRLTRQLTALVDEPEVHGLLALMLPHHARRRGSTRPDRSIVPLADQDRTQWDTAAHRRGNRRQAHDQPGGVRSNGQPMRWARLQAVGKRRQVSRWRGDFPLRAGSHDA
jgi:Family of unknown function (DUF6596)